MKKTLVSVIIPVYNVETFLPYCLDSVVNQTYKELEIIIINDGSTDNSQEICEKYRNKDKRIKLIYQENQGLSAARNRGIEQATGEYISFIDSDDIIDLNFYERLVELMKITSADIAECELIKASEDKVLKGEIKYSKTNNCKYTIINKMEALYKLNSEDVNVVVKSVVVWNKLYKRSLFEGIRYPVGKRYEDDFTTYKILNKINKLVSTDEILYVYVQRNSSIMNQKFSEKRLDALEAFDNYLKFFKEIPDRYLYTKFLLRYLRILVQILNELIESNICNKNQIKDIISNKFREICFELDNTKINLNDKKIEQLQDSLKNAFNILNEKGN